MARIESRPTDATTYNSTQPQYWERDKLDREVNRVFDICHGCRLCFNLCPSFPALFDAVDAEPEGDVRKLSGAEKQRGSTFVTNANCARFDARTRRATAMNSSSIFRL